MAKHRIKMRYPFDRDITVARYKLSEGINTQAIHTDGRSMTIFSYRICKRINCDEEGRIYWWTSRHFFNADRCRQYCESFISSDMDASLLHIQQTAVVLKWDDTAVILQLYGWLLGREVKHLAQRGHDLFHENATNWRLHVKKFSRTAKNLITPKYLEDMYTKIMMWGCNNLLEDVKASVNCCIVSVTDWELFILKMHDEEQYGRFSSEVLHAWFTQAISSCN